MRLNRVNVCEHTYCVVYYVLLYHYYIVCITKIQVRSFYNYLLSFISISFTSSSKAMEHSCCTLAQGNISKDDSGLV